MEHEHWSKIVRAVRAAAVGHRQRQRKFSDVTVVLVLLWAVLHDRPVLWATSPRHWPFYLKIKALPSPATMSRRLRSPSVVTLLERLRAWLLTPPGQGVPLIIDAKPLPVGGYTTDRDARRGRACGCFAWGYKLYLVIDEQGVIHAWKVESMNVAEQAVAEELIPAAARSAGGSRWLLADKAYDSNRLYELAEQEGLWLLAPRITRAGPPGPVQSAGRRRALDMLAPGAQSLGADLLRRRAAVERYLGTLCCTGGGLSPLPGFVRGKERVRRWVEAKLLIHAARKKLSQAVAA